MEVRRGDYLESKMNKSKDAREQSSSLIPVISIYVASFALGYVAHIVISRWLGAARFGDYSVMLSVATIGATIAILGMDKATLKQIPLYLSESQLSLAKGFIKHGYRLILATGLVLLALGLAVYGLISVVRGVEDHPVFLAACLIPVIALADLSGKVLIANGRRNAGVLSVKLQFPALLILFFYLMRESHTLSEYTAALAVAASWGLVLVFQLLRIRGGWHERYGGEEEARRPREWLSLSIPFLMTGLVLVCLHHAGVIMLEVMHASEAEVGIYSAALATANGFFLLFAAVNVMAIPQFSVLVHKGETSALQSETSRYVRFLLLGGLAYLVVLLLWGTPILGLFGAAFKAGQPALLILAVGFMFNIGLGLSTPLLQISGAQRIVITNMVVLLVFTIGLTAALAPKYGAVGGALGFSIPVVIVFGYQAFRTYRNLGILVAPFGSASFR